MGIILFNKTESGDSHSQKPYDTKASLKNESLNNFIFKNIQYPQISRQNHETGTVVISFIVAKDGGIDSMSALEYPTIHLALSAIELLQKTDGQWNPTLLNNNPIDFKYKVVINYQIGNSNLSDQFVVRGDKYLKKEDYSKAIAQYNSAIALLPYKYTLIEKRLRAKELMGDYLGAQRDSIEIAALKEEFLEYATITALSQSGH